MDRMFPPEFWRYLLYIAGVCAFAMVWLGISDFIRQVLE